MTIIDPKATDIAIGEDITDVEFTLLGDEGEHARFRSPLFGFAEMLSKLCQTLRLMQVETERAGLGFPLITLAATDGFVRVGEHLGNILVGFEPNREQVWTHSISLATAKKLAAELQAAIREVESSEPPAAH